MRARCGFLRARVFGVVMVRDDAACGGAHHGVPLADEMSADTTSRSTADTTLGQRGRYRHHQQGQGEKGRETQSDFLDQGFRPARYRRRARGVP